MDDVAQLVRASDCGSEGRGFETHHRPKIKLPFGSFFYEYICHLISKSDLLQKPF